jgi:hypothetical protein
MASIADPNHGVLMNSTAYGYAMDVRRLCEEDIGAWSSLLAVAFNRTQNDMTALLHWMMNGWGLVAYGVWDKDTLVAQYSCLRTRVSIPNHLTPLNVGMSVNMATHPAYRGRGLIKHAASPVYEVLKAEGVIAGVGFSNAAGVTVDRHSKGYGYQVIGKLRSWIGVPSLRQKPSSDFYLTTRLPLLDGLNMTVSGLHFDVTPTEINRRFGLHPFRRYHYGIWEQGGELLGLVIYQTTRILGLPTISLLAAYGHDMNGLLSRWLGCLPIGTLVHVLSTPTAQVRYALSRLKVCMPLLWQKSPYYLTIKTLSDHTPTALLDFAAWDCLGGHIL